MSKFAKELAEKTEQAKKNLTTFYAFDEKDVDSILDEEKSKKKKKKKALIKRVKKLEKEVKKLKKKLKK